MDGNQEQMILRAIAVSSLNLYPQEQATALKVLEDLKKFDGRIALCIAWLAQERHVFGDHDITIPTKLLLLDILYNFLRFGNYTNCDPNDRLQLRQAVLNACKRMAPTSPAMAETRILGKKLASLLAGLVVRDFPQRWEGFVTEVLCPMRQGGLWYNEPGAEAVNQSGCRICLECFKLVAEDCTDSDFNAKISTTRRNDILTGLNEVSLQILTLFFHLLEHVAFLNETRNTLHNMRTYLLSSQRGLSNMTPDESTMYQTQANLQNETGRLLADALQTMKYFCRSMPLDWMLGSSPSSSSGNPNGPNANVNNGGHQLDFIAALLHLLRERTENVQVLAVECLEQLVLRGKLEFGQWYRLISDLPAAIGEANQQFQVEFNEHMPVEQAAQSGSGQATPPNPNEALTLQIDFHRALSRLLSVLLSSYIAHITNDKQILSGSGEHYDKFSAFLRMVVDMLHHPSGIILSEQVGTWTSLQKDPQIAKSRILRPYTQEVISCYMDKMARIRWEDVEEQIHPYASLMEASWDDQDEYDGWMADFRSKSNLMYKFTSHNDPQVAATTISTRVKAILSTHGNGEPINHVNSTNNQLTLKSDAVMQLEGLHQPLDNILGGIPAWALADDPNSDRERLEIRASTRASLSELAQALVSWNPNYLWLKFRRATLLEALKHYWKYDPSTLLQGIDSLLRYLSDPDDWKVAQAAGSPNDNNNFSDEIIGLKKKSGITLVSIAKRVPHHLVPWLSQLSEATKALLSSQQLMSVNQMHLYEFLSCVATAVEDPVARASFIADVLSHSVTLLESVEVQEQLSSVSNFLSSLGIVGAGQYPESVTDIANVKQVTANYHRIFTAINQLLSVGKRCNEAARKRLINGGPLPNGGTGDITVHNFPDEGPMSLRDLAVNDPFAPLWPRFLPVLIKLADVTLNAWHAEHQAVLLPNRLQRYTFAISDDEAFLSKNHDKNSGGVFGEGGTAGSVVSGTDRRDNNLVPKWSGWFNELRHTNFQLMGLLAADRVLYAPELSELYPHFVGALVNPMHLKSMEHRHASHFMKHFVELLLVSCPATLYATHLGPIFGPFVEHMKDRLQKTWQPVIGGGVPGVSSRALFSGDCQAAAAVATRGGDEWFTQYYARAGLMVGDLDAVTAEAAVEKFRVEITRAFCDMLQSCLALKGDWALVLAYQAKEEQASKINMGPQSKPNSGGGPVNADGTPRTVAQSSLDARKLLRINAIPRFLFLENESIAGNLTMTVIQCMAYPDAYTCRRVTKISHRILEIAAWAPHYANLLGNQMFTQVVKNIVTEPKWMVGIEWDMINVARDIYCRLVLGQYLQPGGQGPGLQQATLPLNPNEYEQAKSVDRPLQGGGILTTPSNLPRHVLASLPGINMESIDEMDKRMKEKRGAKDQKDVLRDLLRAASDNLKQIDESRGANSTGSAAAGIFDRAIAEESLLHSRGRASVQDLPEKLVTRSMVEKQRRPQEQPDGPTTLFA